MGFERHIASLPFERTKHPKHDHAYGGEFSKYVGSLVLLKKPRILSAANTSKQTVQDEIFDLVTGATYVNDYEWVVESNLPEDTEPTTLLSEDSSVASVTGTKITHNSVGTTKLTYTLPKFEFQIRRELEFKEISGNSILIGTRSFTEGSLRRHIKEGTDALLIDGKSKDIYLSHPSNSNYTDEGEVRGGVDEWIRNPNCWASGIDLTCNSPAYRPSGQTTWRRSPTATTISPVHYVTAEHYPVTTGHTVAYVTADGTLITRLVVGVLRVPNTDFRIGIFDTPLPESIKPAKALPTNYKAQAPRGLLETPALLTDQQSHAMVHFVLRYSPSHINFNWDYKEGFYDTGEENRVWDGPGWEMFDSGSPAFSIINNELVILGTASGGGGGAGPDFSTFRSEIQETMNSLSATQSKQQYDLVSPDLSTFTNFN